MSKSLARDWRYRVAEADALPKGWQAVGFDDKGWDTPVAEIHR